MNKETLKGHLPVLVLGILAEQPRHGYALCNEIKARAAGILQLGEGTLYPLLHRLEHRGHVRGEWQTGPRGKSLKVYHVTRRGQRLIRAHQADWQSLARLFKQFVGKDWAKA